MNDFTTTIKVDRTPAEVRTALTSTQALAAWWTPVTGNGEAGGELAFYFSGSEPTVMRVDEASTELVHWTCLRSGDAADWVGTEITFTIEPVVTSTVIFFQHHGLTPQLECFESCFSGWTHFMTSLAQYLETGIGMPFRSEGDMARRRADSDPLPAN